MGSPRRIWISISTTELNTAWATMRRVGRCSRVAALPALLSGLSAHSGVADSRIAQAAASPKPRYAEDAGVGDSRIGCRRQDPDFPALLYSPGRTDRARRPAQTRFLRGGMHPWQLVGARAQAPDRNAIFRAVRALHGQGEARRAGPRRRRTGRPQTGYPRPIRFRVSRPAAEGGRERIRPRGRPARQTARLSAGTGARLLFRGEASWTWFSTTVFSSATCSSN